MECDYSETNTARRAFLAATPFLTMFGPSRAVAKVDVQDQSASGKPHFAVINHAVDNPFFTAVKYGIQDACEKFGYDYIWAGSRTSNVQEMLDAFYAAMAAKCAGIAISLVDPEAFNSAVEKALSAGIPVVAYNADAPPSSANKRLAYIGQDLVEAGARLGRKLCVSGCSDKIAVFGATPDQLNIAPRIEGLKQGVRQFGDYEEFPIVRTGTDPTGEVDAVKSFVLSNPAVKMLIGVDGGTTQAVGQVMHEFDLRSQGYHAVGFDLLPRTAELVRDGLLDFVIEQQPYVQGYYTVAQLHVFRLSGGMVGPADVDTGAKISRKASAQFYLTQKSRYQGLSSEYKEISRSGPIEG